MEGTEGHGDGAMDGGNLSKDGWTVTSDARREGNRLNGTSGWWCRLSASADRFWPANNWIPSMTSAKRLYAKRTEGR